MTRSQGRSSDVFDVSENSFTIMPALEAYRWATEGPIDFAHVALSRDFLEQITIEELDREPNLLQLRPVVGGTDTLAGTLFQALFLDLERPAAGRLYREGLLVALACTIVRRFSDVGGRGCLYDPCCQNRRAAKGGLAGWQLRRVIDHMRAYLSEDVVVSQLVTMTGLSRAHFFRAFGRSTGRSPYAYLVDCRVRRARELLSATDLPIASVAAAVGFEVAQLSAALRGRLGLSPSAYRRENGGLLQRREP